jgi:hypothetical protein
MIPSETLGWSIECNREEVIGKGIAWFEPYCLRHTALTRLAEAGCDAFTLARIAGHSSITITQRYCHPQAKAIGSAFAKLQPVPIGVKSEGSMVKQMGKEKIHGVSI